MSRRAAGPDKSEQNRATLKQLVKLETNKSCADCKRNKHPRWASWNIGVFICIRCSGIHRSMGVHISRVKSVDLDSWTDEQMASMLRWGNARANKYWEHKLAMGHVPNEAKIENFIRTKYDSRRWVMDGPMPDPSTLDDGSADDDVPLNVVKEKAIERTASLRNGGAAVGGGSLPQAPRQRPQQVDLFGDMEEPARPSTTEPAVSRAPPPKAPAAPPKQTRPNESLLGLDFFGGTQSAPPRPSSAASGLGTPGAAPGRADLKNSILSLYASAPKPAAAVPQQQQQPQQQARSNVDFFGGMQSPPLTSPTQSSAQSMGGMNDAFSSLSFSSQPQAKPAPFSGLTSPTAHGRQKSSLSGGSFFDVKPAPPPKHTPPPPQAARKPSNSFGGDFGDFSSAPSPVTTTKSPPPPTNTSSMGDLFSMSSPPPQQTKPAPAPAPAPKQNLSFPTAAAFNLSTPTQPPAPKPAPPVQTSSSAFDMGTDAWGSNDAWATPDPPAPQPSQAPKPAPAPAPAPAMSAFDNGWGDPEPAPKPAASTSGGGFSVQQDEEFGGWSHASPVATNSGPKQGGLGGNQDDLFGNVWG